MGCPQHGGVRLRQRAVLLVKEGEALGDAGRGVEAGDAGGDDAGDARGRELAGGGELPAALGGLPLAVLVVLADYAGADVLAPVVQLLLELVLDDLALLLDDEDLLQAAGEVAHAVRVERPGHADLEHAQADAGGERRVDAQRIERLQHVQVRLAGGDDAQARGGGIDHHPVQAVQAGIGHGGIHLPALQPHLLLQRRVGPADRQPARRQREVGGDAGVDAGGVHHHAGGGLHRVGDRLHADPAAGESAHRPAVQAEVQEFLHARGVEHRHHGGGQDVVALVGQGGGLGAVVIAHHQQHAAMGRGAGGVGVLEHVHRAVGAGALAVPQAEHAIVLGAGEQADLLGAPDRSGGELLVHAGLEGDVVRGQPLGLAPQRLVEPA